MVEKIQSSFRISEVSIINLHLQTELPRRGLRDLPHVNSRIVFQIRLKSLPSKTIPNYISPVTLQLDATDWTLKTSLNKK